MIVTSFDLYEVSAVKLLGSIALVMAVSNQRFVDAEQAGKIVRNDTFREWASRQEGRKEPRHGA